MIANLRYAARSGEKVWIGGGEFSGRELAEVADKLEAFDDMLKALQTLVPHVMHYAAMPGSHVNAHRDAANANGAIIKGGGAA